MRSTATRSPFSIRNWDPLLCGLGLAAAGTLAIAFGGVLAAMAETGPIGTAMWRLLLAGLVFVVVASQRLGIDVVVGHIRANPDLLVAAFAFAGPLAFWYMGQRLSSVANAAVLHNMAPVLIAGVMWLVLRRATGAKVIFGLILAIAGSVLLVASSHAGGVSTPVVGDGLSLLAAVCYALYFVFLSRALTRLPLPCLMCMVCLFGAAALFPVALLAGETLVPPTLGSWLTVTGVALFGSLVGQGLIAWSMRSLSAFQASSTVLLEPIFAAVIAAVLLAQTLSSGQMLAGAIAIAGVALCQLYGHRLANS